MDHHLLHHHLVSLNTHQQLTSDLKCECPCCGARDGGHIPTGGSTGVLYPASDSCTSERMRVDRVRLPNSPKGPPSSTVMTLLPGRFWSSNNAIPVARQHQVKEYRRLHMSAQVEEWTQAMTAIPSWYNSWPTVPFTAPNTSNVGSHCILHRPHRTNNYNLRQCHTGCGKSMSWDMNYGSFMRHK